MHFFFPYYILIRINVLVNRRMAEISEPQSANARQTSSLFSVHFREEKDRLVKIGIWKTQG